jgi:hypothetical protein
MRPFATHVGAAAAIPMADIFAQLATQLKELQDFKDAMPNAKDKSST